MSERIDAFSHILPESFIDGMNDLHPTDELQEMTNADHLIDVDNRLGDMEDFGVDRQVLTLARPSIWRGIDRDVALEAIQLANDAINEVANDHPDRFIPVGTLPLLGEGFVEELERCVRDLGMPGVQIFSNVEGKPLDAEEFHPFWEAVENLDATVWIHPQLHDWHDWTDDYMDHKMLGWPFDTSIAMARLVWSGIMDEHDPDVITHHMGGMTPFYSERIEKFYDKRMTYRDVYPRTELPEFDDGPKAQFRKFYGDLAVSGSESALDCGHDFFGTEQLVFAADYPFSTDGGRKCYEDTIPILKQLDVPEEEKDAIFGENLKTLL